MKEFQISIKSLERKGSRDLLIPDNCLIAVLSDLQNAIKATSLVLINDLEKDLKYRSIEYSNQYSIAIDATKNRIREHKGPTFFITGFRNGSLVLTGALTALGYYILSKTIGETLGEAWKETEMHRIIKDWFVHKMDAIPEMIRNQYRRRINHKVENGTIENFGFDYPSNIDIDIYITPKDEIPFFALDDEDYQP